jgi:hypothetical protein
MTKLHYYKMLILSCITVCVFALLSFLAPATAHFRDSGEFLVAALFLDITHPPGAPLYAQLANIFAQLPLGAISWRIHLFSALVAAVSLGVLWWLTYTLAALRSRRRRLNLSFTALVAPLLVLGTASFYRSALMAEVYGLHMLIVLILLCLIVRFERSFDIRWLYLACFTAGLGAANHAAIAPLVVIAVPCLLIGRWKQLRSALLPGIAFVVIGLATYAYLPLRATTTLPLNTGSPNTASRLANHLSNERDRVLKVDSTDSELSKWQRFSQLISGDAQKFAKETSPVTLLLGSLGLLVLLVKSVRIGSITLSAFLLQWYFFAGWDSDPWLLNYALLGLGLAIFINQVIEQIDSAELARALPVILAALCFVYNFTKFAPEKVLNFSAYDVPVRAAEAILDATPAYGTVIADPSWFLLNYLQTLEGYRQDVSVIYQPSILFPKYFAPISLTSEAGQTYRNSDKQNEDPLLQLGAFLRFAGPSNKLQFEPNNVLNGYLAGVARCNEMGAFKLISGQPSNLSQACLPAASQMLSPLQAAASIHAPLFRSDNMNYFEAKLNGIADLFSRAGEAAIAISLMESACAPQNGQACSVVSIHNLALYLIEDNNNLRATEIMAAHLKANPHTRNLLEQRFRQAFFALSTDEKRKLLRQFPDLGMKLL